jgi:hypothetical protein
MQIIDLEMTKDLSDALAAIAAINESIVREVTDVAV